MNTFIPEPEAIEYVGQLYESTHRVSRLPTDDFLLVGGTPRDIVLDRLDPLAADADFLGPFDFPKIMGKFPDRIEAYWPKYKTLKLRVGNALLDLTYCDPAQFLDEVGQYDLNISMLVARANGHIEDNFGVLESIEQRLITVGDPERRLAMDPSRILRVARFATTLGFQVDVELFAAMKTNAARLPSTDYEDDLQKILALKDEHRAAAVTILNEVGVNVHKIKMPYTMTEKLHTLRSRVLGYPAVSSVRELLDDVETVYLVGGATRDAIRDFPPKDFDFKVRIDPEGLRAKLESHGLSSSDSYDIGESDYYYNPRNGCFSIVIDGVDIDLAPVRTADIDELIKGGDLNINCCVYDIHDQVIVNPDKYEEIEQGMLYFCDEQAAMNDPVVIVNALKHISRDPSIAPTDTTIDIIFSAVEAVYEFFSAHPEMRYKLESVGGNINTHSILEIIESSSAHEAARRFLYDAIAAVPERIHEIPGYLYVQPDDHDTAARIRDFVVERYGQSVDPRKVQEMFGSSQKVYVRFDEKDEVDSVFTLEGSRVYTTAARNNEGYIEMLRAIRRHVPYPWATVDLGNRKIQALVTSAGFHQISNPYIASKLLNGSNKAVQPTLFGVVASNELKDQIVYGK